MLFNREDLVCVPRLLIGLLMELTKSHFWKRANQIYS
jgi:hypothetical protein